MHESSTMDSDRVSHIQVNSRVTSAEMGVPSHLSSRVTTAALWLGRLRLQQGAEGISVVTGKPVAMFGDSRRAP